MTYQSEIIFLFNLISFLRIKFEKHPIKKYNIFIFFILRKKPKYYFLYKELNKRKSIYKQKMRII